MADLRDVAQGLLSLSSEELDDLSPRLVAMADRVTESRLLEGGAPPPLEILVRWMAGQVAVEARRRRELRLVAFSDNDLLLVRQWVATLSGFSPQIREVWERLLLMVEQEEDHRHGV